MKPLHLIGLTIATAILIIIAWLAGREVRVAVLPADGEATANLAALLESQLTDRPGVAVVERAAVESILREQKLQSLFAPDAVGRRAALGKLLKADLLLMLRKASLPQKGFELIACDTSQGLRLCVERVGPNGDASVVVAQLQSVIAQALKKREESITQIIAVPPLISNDLDLAAQVLQRPLAKVIEQALLARPGVVVVETAEAKALASELAVSDGTLSGAGIERKLPLYLLGEYRHNSFAKDSPLRTELRLMRGDKQVGIRESSRMTIAAAGATLSRKALELLDGASESIVPNVAKPIAGDEAQQLARRAQTMHQAESWTEATDLAEASLLLNPAQAPMHRLAADALQLEARRLDEARNASASNHAAKPENLANEQRNIQALYAQGLPHLEAFMTASAFTMKADFVVLSPYFHHCTDHTALRAMMLRVLAAKQSIGSSDETVRTCAECVATCRDDMSAEDFDRWRLDAARAWPDAADQDGQYLAAFMATNTNLDDHDKVQWLARSLGEMDTPVATQAAQRLTRMAIELTALIKAQESAAVVAKPPIVNRTRPAAIVRRYPLPLEIWSAVSAGESSDVAWGRNMLYQWPVASGSNLHAIMRIKAEAGGTPVCFDGQFVWACGIERLVAIDIGNHHTTTLGNESGLPSDAVRAVSIAPLAPGKVCVVGHFGPSVGGRVWIAIATLNKSSLGNIKIFHEARDFNSGPAANWKNSHLAFDVSRTHMLRLKKPGGDMQTAIVVERGAMGHPLLIDPETLNVSVIEDPVCGEYPSQLVEHGGALYWIGTSDRGYRVCRYALPECKIEYGNELFAQPGNLFFYKKRVGLIHDGQLLLADDPMGKFRPIEIRMESDVKTLFVGQPICSDKHGLLFSSFGELHEMALP